MYLLSKDGFTLLTMGYTGEKAMAFKIAYIARFNEMEEQLRAASVKDCPIQLHAVPSSPTRRKNMPLPMPEEEENLRCPHGERYQALMLCSLDCAISGAHPDRKAKADGRFIITPWWCLHKCRWLPEHRDEIRFVAKKSD